MNPRCYTVDVVSPQYPCGAAWLANALLELQVRLRHLWGFDTDAEWEDDVDGQSTYVASHLPWHQTLSSLQMGRRFQFRSDVRPRFSHAFPWTHEFSGRTVLMVRDPRDALHSEWQRHRRNEGLPSATSFREFLRMPFFGGPISQVDMLWLHLTCWNLVRKEKPDRVYLLRFEDWKSSPVVELAAVTRWMGLHCKAESLVRATAASDVSHLLAIEKSLHVQAPNSRQFNRIGLPNEWRQSWQPGESQALGRHWSDVFQSLGYTRPKDFGVVKPAFNLGEVLAWRELFDPVQVQQWSDRLSAVN